MRRKAVHLDPEVGRILISEPFLLDSYFKRAVILLGEHSEEGTVGFILNKPPDMHLNTLGQKLEGSKEILPGIFWGGDLEMLKLLIDTHQVTKNDIRFFAGYSGWEPQQLTEELKGHTWLISNCQKDFAFSEHPEELWGEVLKTMGSQYAILANFPDDPSLN